MKIRKATIKDLDAICVLNQKLFKYDYSNFDKTIDISWAFGNGQENMYRKDIIGKNSVVFVAIIEEKIVGYILCKIIDGEVYSKDKKVAFLEDMFVLEEYRGKGIGARLVKEFFKWEKSKGMKRATVTVSIKNKAAIGFYKSAGFVGQDLVLERKI